MKEFLAASATAHRLNRKPKSWGRLETTFAKLQKGASSKKIKKQANHFQSST